MRSRKQDRLLLPHARSAPITREKKQMAAQVPATRTKEQILEHYHVEKELAQKLRRASRDERRGLYTEVYDELLKRVRHHPLLHAQRTPEDIARTVNHELARLAPYINADTVFLEVGAGGCQLSLALSARVKRVIAVDVSNEITAHVEPPPNFELVISDGTSIPVPPGSVDVAFSNQLMEHLHPDDALDQLREIYTALVPGGTYLCFTPNGMSGPHDVSRGFDTVATGFHLHEYTVTELDRMFRHVGFRRTRVILPKGNLRVPASAVMALESAVGALPGSLSRKVAYLRPMRECLGIRVVARK
jgi:SAM-dependent methyltransferase